jgi:hypothetical protein
MTHNFLKKLIELVFLTNKLNKEKYQQELTL